MPLFIKSYYSVGYFNISSRRVKAILGNKIDFCEGFYDLLERPPTSPSPPSQNENYYQNDNSFISITVLVIKKLLYYNML